MLKAKLSNYYRKTAILMVFVYVVTGTAEEIEAYAATQGANFRKNDAGQALFFSTRLLSTNRNESIPLTITTNGRIVADDLNKVLKNEEKFEDYVLQERAKLTAAHAMGANGLAAVAELTASRNVATAEEVEEVIAAPVEIGDDIPT